MKWIKRTDSRQNYFSYDCFLEGIVLDRKGRNVKKVLNFNNFQLEFIHDYIQEMFPLDVQSNAIDIVPLTKKEIKDLSNNLIALESIRKMYFRMLEFWKLDGERYMDWGKNAPFRHWNLKNNHNYYRMTRVLKCLKLLKMRKEYEDFCKRLSFLIQLFENRKYIRISKKTISIWNDEINLPFEKTVDPISNVSANISATNNSMTEESLEKQNLIKVNIEGVFYEFDLPPREELTYIISENSYPQGVKYAVKTSGDEQILVYSKEYSLLKEAVIPEGITAIDYGAFIGCEYLLSVDIPDSVKIINERAFFYCKRLQNIKFGNGLTCIKNNAFAKCFALESLELPDTLTLIQPKAFFMDENIKRVGIPKDLEGIKRVEFLYALMDNNYDKRNKNEKSEKSLEIIGKEINGKLNIKYVESRHGIYGYIPVPDESPYISLKSCPFCSLNDFKIIWSLAHYKYYPSYMDFLKQDSSKEKTWIHIFSFLTSNSEKIAFSNNKLSIQSVFEIINNLLEDGIFDDAVDDIIDFACTLKENEKNSMYTEIYLMLVKRKEKTGNYNEDIISRFDL